MTTPERRLSLSEFLSERIAEDREVAEAALKSCDQGSAYGAKRYQHWSYDQKQSPPSKEAGTVWNGKGQSLASFASDYSGPHMVRWDPIRVLAECEAKRRVRAMQIGDEIDRILALPYADHEAYDESWRP